MWESWLGFFGSSAPRWEDSAAERKRRLTLNRLLQSLSASIGSEPQRAARLVRWFETRDAQRSGRISFDDFCLGLRVNGHTKLNRGPAQQPGPWPPRLVTLTLTPTLTLT